MKLFIIIGSVFGLLAVAAGAFGAHGLEGKLSTDMLDVWETAVRYQMFHALALFGAAWLFDQTGSGWATAAAALFVGGVLVFSGTLYALALSGIKWLGAITPIGGVALIAGWACCIVAALRLE